MLSIRITITNATRKAMEWMLDRAYERGDRRLVKRITALLSLVHYPDVRRAADIARVSQKSVYTWLHALLADGLDSLHYRTSPGRPPRLTKTQKQRLVDVVRAGPIEAGFVTECWTSLLVQQW